MKSRFALFVFLIYATPLFGADKSPLEIVPADAMGSLSIQNLDGAIDKSEKLFDEMQVKRSWNLSQLFDMGLNYLGIDRGVDRSGTICLVLMPWEEEQNRNFNKIFESIVLRIPFSEVDDMAKNFTLPEEGLVEGKIHKINNRLNQNEPAYITRHENAILLSMRSEAIEAFLKSTKLNEANIADGDNRLAESDMLLHVNLGEVLKRERNRNNESQDYLQELIEHVDPEKRELVQELNEKVRFGFFSSRIDAGVNIRFQATFSRELSPGASALLAKWGSRSSEPNVNHLPTTDLILAASKTAQGFRDSVEAQETLRYLLKEFISDSRVSPNLKALIDPSRDTFQGVFDEMWATLKEARTAVYLNENVTDHGLISFLAILKPDDPAQYYEQLGELIKFSRGTNYDPESKKEQPITPEEIRQLIAQLGDQKFRVRRAATLRLKLLGDPARKFLKEATDAPDAEIAARSTKLLAEIEKSLAERQKEILDKGLQTIPVPEFVLYENSQEMLGYRVDVLSARWDKEQDAVKGRLQEFLGPQGNEILLVHVDDEIVVFLGSRRELLTECLTLLKEDGPGLQEKIEPFRKYDSPGRILEVHYSIQKLQPTLMPQPWRKPPKEIPLTDDLSSFSLEIAPTHMRVDLHSPPAEFRRVSYFMGIF